MANASSQQANAVSDGRLSRLRTAMREANLESFYCRDISNVKWLTGFENVFDDEPAHLAYVTADAASLHTDSRYVDACNRAAAGSAWEVDGCGGTHAAWAGKAVKAACEAKGDISGLRGRMGIEDEITLREFRQLEEALAKVAHAPQLIATDAVVRTLRVAKDAAEVAAMKAAQAITDAAFSHIIEYMREGMTELQVKTELEETMRRLGAEDLAFASIIASGPNGAAPHSIPGQRTLTRGDLVVMDFGARAQGYCSDMTRTVAIGEVTPRAREVFNAVREANETVEAMLRPGVTGAQAHALAEQVLADHGFAGKMGHGLGHGVGIDIHELPILSPRNEKPLEAGNVVTVEPGVYLPGEVGCRLEDFGVITEDGYEVFTASTHELVVI